MAWAAVWYTWQLSIPRCKIHFPAECKRKCFPVEHVPHHLYHPPMQTWEKDSLFWQSCLSNENYLGLHGFQRALSEGELQWTLKHTIRIQCHWMWGTSVICNIKDHWCHLERQLGCPSYIRHGEKKPETCSFSSDTLTRQTHAPLKITQLCSHMFPSHVSDLKICLSSECYAY